MAPSGLAPAWHRGTGLGAVEVEEGAEVQEASPLVGDGDPDPPQDEGEVEAQPKAEEDTTADIAAADGDAAEGEEAPPTRKRPPPPGGRPLLGGTDESAAVVVLRGAIREREDVSDNMAARMAEARWRQLSNANKAFLVDMTMRKEELGEFEYEVLMGVKEGALWKSPPPAQPARVERRRPLLGGPEETTALGVLRFAIQADPELSQVDTEDLAEVEWQRLTAGERATFVLETLPNLAYDYEVAAWAELDDEERENVAKAVFDRNEKARDAAQVIVKRVRKYRGIVSPTRPPSVRPISTRPLLGGPEEDLAILLLRAALRAGDLQMTEADAASMAEEQWQRMTNGEKAAFVQQTLPNEASEWKPKSWRALSEEQRGVVAQRVFEESKHAKQAAKLMAGMMRTAAALDAAENAGVAVTSSAAPQAASTATTTATTTTDAPVVVDETTVEAPSAVEETSTEAPNAVEETIAEAAEETTAEAPSGVEETRAEAQGAAEDVGTRRPIVGGEYGRNAQPEAARDEKPAPVSRAPRVGGGQFYRQGEASLALDTDVEKAAYALLKEAVAVLDPSLEGEDLSAEAASRWRQLTDNVRASYLNRARVALAATGGTTEATTKAPRARKAAATRTKVLDPRAAALAAKLVIPEEPEASEATEAEPRKRWWSRMRRSSK